MLPPTQQQQIGSDSVGPRSDSLQHAKWQEHEDKVQQGSLTNKKERKNETKTKTKTNKIKIKIKIKKKRKIGRKNTSPYQQQPKPHRTNNN